MSKIRLHGTSSGYTEIVPKAAAASNTLTAPSTVGELIAKDAAGAIGITSVQATNANFSGTIRVTSGIVTTANVTTLRATTGIVTTFTATNATFAGDIDPTSNWAYDIGASNLKFKQLFVNSIDASAGIVTAKTFAPTEGQLSHRNLIINGAMLVAQRGTSSTGTNYKTVDRFKSSFTGQDEVCTQSQISLTSSDTGPWAKGFRKAYQHQNGNQTSGAGAGDYAYISYIPEAQDIANSGWDYTSSSSYITLSFWVKSSVAQNFYGHFQSDDGTGQRYAFETGSLSANTWTYVTKKIPGNSNITMSNNNGVGFYIYWWQFLGTDRTDSGVALETWGAYAGGTRTPDNTSTWWTTNDATWAITGVQLEVGSYATPFEHRSFGDELRRCQRYYEKSYAYGTAPGTAGDNGRRLRRVCATATNQVQIIEETYQVKKRTTPTVTTYSTDGTSGKMSIYNYGVSTVHVTASQYGSTDTGFEVNGSGTANSAAVFWQADADL